MSLQTIPIILIAEDNPSCQLLLTEFLKPLEVRTIFVSNGAQAFEECVGNLDIKVVIMDIRMPVMDGLEAVRLIRKYRPDLPVIIYTALNSQEYRYFFKKLNCNDFFVKPVSPRIVVETVAKYLNIRTDIYSPNN
jgi:two-component system cell cycle response regulator DivK